MKKIIAIAMLSLLNLSAFAQIPQELNELIPEGKSNLRLLGRTKDNKNCVVSISNKSNAYSVALGVLDAQGDLDSRRFGNFQIGFGHELQSLEQQGNQIIATSIHEAEESYSSDSRSTVKVNKSGDNIKSVQIVLEEEALFGFKTKVNETCIVK